MVGGCHTIPFTSAHTTSNITNAYNIHVNGTKPISYIRMIMIDFKFFVGENGRFQGLGKRKRERICAAPVLNET